VSGSDRGGGSDPRYRRATPDDAIACNELMWSSVTDLAARQGTPPDNWTELKKVSTGLGAAAPWP
jgi:hypothetical protein